MIGENGPPVRRSSSPPRGPAGRVGRRRWALVSVPFALLSFLTRLKLGDAFQNLIWARNQVRDLPDPDSYKSGVLLSVRAHPSPLTGLEEPLIAEIVEDHGEAGTAKIVSDPLGGVAIVPHGSGPLTIRKGDVIRYHRKEDSYPGIFAKLVGTPSNVDA